MYLYSTHNKNLASKVKRLICEHKKYFNIHRIIFCVRIVRDSDAYMTYQLIFPLPVVVIEVDEDCRLFSDDALLGLVAHELAHHCVLIDNIKTLAKNIMFGRFHDAIEIITLNIERIADILAVNLGYSKQLIKFHEEHNKTYRKYKKQDGLTLKELRKYGNQK